MNEKKFTNRLIKETSPYLLQHAHNPVDWYPWSEEAFEQAKKENKPVFLSVGYSACHWCHVMEHESFEDEETAMLMNKLFINIKIDREERPDVDIIYMNFVQMISGHGGWPMSVFMTPDKKPFFGGTYFPNTRRYNMPSFKDVLTSVNRLYTEKKEDVLKDIDIIVANLQHINEFKPVEGELSAAPINKALVQLENYFDSYNGGFGQQPKFPNTFNLELFLRKYQNTKERKYLDMVELTMKKMSNGGIYDHLGGGFFRYSVDDHWLIPHFEKMLYDNALLIKLLLEVYQITGNIFYRDKASESLEYVIREMTQESGGFYSTQDADSEGEEGKFYAWKFDEITDILGTKDGEIFCKYYGVTKHGNFEHGKSNLNVEQTVSELAKELKLNVDELSESIKKSKNILFDLRTKRVYPGKDTKILTSWNGLMISTFVKGYQVLKNDKYLEIARKSVNFIFENLYNIPLTPFKGGASQETSFQECLLRRSYKDEQAKFNAYLEDYTFLTDALIDLYQATLEDKWLEKAKILNQTTIDQFWDEKDGGFFFTGKNHEELIVRTKEIVDHSIPAANTVAVKNLLRLARLTENKEFVNKAEQTFKTFSTTISKYSTGVSSMLCALDYHLKSPMDAVLVGKNLEEIKPFIEKLNESFNPEMLIYFLNTEKQDLSLEIHKEKVSISEKPTAYICHNFVCLKPVTSSEEIKVK